jgi:hypothetical protein
VHALAVHPSLDLTDPNRLAVVIDDRADLDLIRPVDGKVPPAPPRLAHLSEGGASEDGQHGVGSPGCCDCVEPQFSSGLHALEHVDSEPIGLEIVDQCCSGSDREAAGSGRHCAPRLTSQAHSACSREVDRGCGRLER